MKYSIKQQAPYIALIVVMSWLYIYLFPTKYAWLSAIFVIPLITISMWSIKKYTVPYESFSILGALKRGIWLIIAFPLASCYDHYQKTGVFSLWYFMAMTIMGIVTMVILERSLYD